MSTPFLGEIKIISWNFPPKGWAFCNGQLLPINQNQALFSILGTTYGGNGQTNFALPNLQGRVPVHVGNSIIPGQSAGEPTHTLAIAEMPSHTHVPVGSSAAASVGTPAGNTWPTKTGAYSNTADTAMNSADLLSTGGSQPHENRSPYLVLSFVIALQGIFPTRN